MAPPPSRSSALLLIGVVAVALIAFGAYWMLNEAPSTGTGGTVVPAIVDDSDSGTDLPRGDPMTLPEGVEQAPEPITVDQVTPSATPGSNLWEDPLVVVGSVEDPQQERIPDVEVNLFDDLGEYLDSVFTDQRGEFQFHSEEGLPAGWSLGTEPEFADSDDPTVLAPAFYTHATAVIPGKPPVYAKLIMGRPPRIEGKVFDAETGAPIESADVEVVCMSPAWEAEYQDDYTDEAGYYGMNLVDVAAHDIIMRVEDDDDRYAIIGPMSLRPGEVRVIDVGLTEPLPLEGYVISAADGSPIGGAQIDVLPAHLEFEEADAWTMSDSDGEWVIDDIGTQPDNIWVLAQEDDYGPALVQVNDPAQLIEIQLGDYVTVAGQLTNATTAEPVDDAEIRFILEGPSGLLEDYEDLDFCEDDGTFAIMLEMCPARGAVVIVEADGYMKYRMHLSKLAPTELDLRDYHIVIALTPLPDAG